MPEAGYSLARLMEILYICKLNVDDKNSLSVQNRLKVSRLCLNFFAKPFEIPTDLHILKHK